MVSKKMTIRSIENIENFMKFWVQSCDKTEHFCEEKCLLFQENNIKKKPFEINLDFKYSVPSY